MSKAAFYFQRILLITLSFLILFGTAFYFIPLSAAWYAAQLASRSDYFFQDEEQWLKEHTLWEVGTLKLLELKLRRDLTSHLVERLQLGSKSEPEAIELAVNEVRSLYITQLQQKLPVISNSTTVSFVRGYGFCDQINAALALVLHEKLEQVHLYGVVNPPDEARHTLIKAQSSLGTLWIDAFTCVNAFGFPEELTVEGKKCIPVYKGKAPFLFEEEAYKEGFFFNEFSFQYSCKKAFNRIKSLLINKTYNPEQVMVMKKPDALLAIAPERQRSLMQEAEKEAREAKEAYLTARIFHLYGDEEKALSFYEKAQRESVNGMIGSYAATFIRRLKGEEVLCRQ